MLFTAPPLAKPLAALALSTLLTFDTTVDSVLKSPPSIPIVEVIKVYGKLAGPECYGKIAPKGSSCQITLNDIEKDFKWTAASPQSQAVSRDEFNQRIAELDFQWPLKPYGVDSSLAKTVTMKKGAETRVFMEELEARGLYDRRNPTGPLPTSLRPQLNAILNHENVDTVTINRVFDALRGTDAELQAGRMQELFKDGMDYYGFLDMLGKNSISWPY